MITVKNFRDITGDDMKQSLLIRRKVFVEEQGVPEEHVFDYFEDDSMHYLVFVDKNPVGTARWRKQSIGIKMERFAVIREYRNRGLGSSLLNAMLGDLRDKYSYIYLNAQESAVSFYLQRGFQVEGPEFVIAGVPHYKMLYKD